MAGRNPSTGKAPVIYQSQPLQPHTNPYSPRPLLASALASSHSSSLPVTNLASPGEVDLLLRARTGNQASFGELVELHQDTIFNQAYRILQDYSEADDATQEAFIKIWQALPGFLGNSKFTTWTYRIVRNTCLNRLRSAKSGPRTVSVEDSFEEGDESGRDLVANLPSDHSVEPASCFDTDERRQLIWNQVDSLPVKYREIIGLYYAHEMGYEEIAAALEIPVGTVKTHLYRAKGLLKAKLLELNNQGWLDIAT